MSKNLSKSIQNYIELFEMDGSIADPILIEFREEAAALEAKLEAMEQIALALWISEPLSDVDMTVLNELHKRRYEAGGVAAAQKEQGG